MAKHLQMLARGHIAVSEPMFLTNKIDLDSIDITFTNFTFDIFVAIRNEYCSVREPDPGPRKPLHLESRSQGIYCARTLIIRYIKYLIDAMLINFDDVVGRLCLFLNDLPRSIV